MLHRPLGCLSCVGSLKYPSEYSRVILIQLMQSLKRMTGLLRGSLQTPLYQFSKDGWKDRDEASEKVYISQAEKETIKKLLKKVEIQEAEQLNNNAEFEKGLRAILQKYKVENEVFFSEVSNLHKSTSD